MRLAALSCRSAALASATALSLLACGGEDLGRPSAGTVKVPPLDQCGLAANYEFQSIVNFEPRMTPTGGINRYAYCDSAIPCEAVMPTPFYFNYDKAHSEPLPNNLTPAMLPTVCPTPPAKTSVTISKHEVIEETEPREVNGQTIPEGARCGVSANAMRFSATNLAMCVGPNGRLGWGAGLDLNFADPGLLDASAWDGIAFWVKRGDAPSGAALVFSVIDAQNEGVGGEFDQEKPPGCGCYRENPVAAPTHWTCSTDPGPEYPDVVKCDAFGAAVSLTEDWSFVPVTFSAMRQKGFGFASLPFDRSRISRLQFLMTFGEWDFWLDDIALFRKR
jgi:hypothetical protein